MAFYQKIAAHTLYQILARIASSGVSFLITIFIARHFGVSAYGDYAKVTAFVTMFYLFVDFGFNAMFLQKDGADEHFHDLFYTRIIFAVVLVGLINVITFFLPYDAATNVGFSPFVRSAIALFSLTIITESILFSTFVVFQRRYIYEKFMVATILGSFVTLSLVGIFILSGFSLFWVFIAFVIGAVVEASCSLLFVKEKIFPVVVHVQFVRELFYETLPVAFMLVFNLLYFRIDTFLLSLYRPSADVGLYNIAYSVFDFLIALPLFLSNVLYPKLIIDEKNNRNVKRMVRIYGFIFFGLGLLVAIPFWFVSPLIFLIIKPELLPAITPLRLLLLSLPIFFATNILQWILLSKKQQKYLSVVYSALTLVNILLNVLFIPYFGYIASAIITGIGEAIVLILFLWKLFRTEL